MAPRERVQGVVDLVSVIGADRASRGDRGRNPPHGRPDRAECRVRSRQEPDPRRTLTTEVSQPEGREPPREVIDVDALMADLRRRVAEKKARGLYTVDALVVDAAETVEPWRQEDLERLRALSVLRVDLAGDGLHQAGHRRRWSAWIKRRLARSTSGPLYGLAAQENAFHAPLLAYLSQLAREVTELGHRVEHAQDATGQVQRALGDGEVERQRELGQVAGRVEEVVDRLEALAGRLEEAERQMAGWREAALPERVARLEVPDPAVAAGAPATARPTVPAGGLARLRREAAEPDDPARWAAHAEAFAGAGPVLHLGAGLGRALPALGPGARGLEGDAEVAAAAAREGRAVAHADPVAELAAAEPGSLRAILVSDLVERLDGAGLAALAAAAARALAPGGLIVVEGLNPAALWAVGEEAWRDPDRRRPLHPDAVRLALETAGLEVVAVRELGPPDEGAAPPPASGDPDHEALRRALERLSAAVFAPRRYAVHARR